MAAKSVRVAGFTGWCEAYQKKIPNIKKMQNEIDLFMMKYDKEIQEEKEKEKEMDGQEDEDGWVTVTKHGKHKGIPRTEVQEKKVSNREKKRRKEKDLLNFYSFQQRETKRELIAQLRQKFAEDKQKIMMMKANRKFRPY